MSNRPPGIPNRPGWMKRQPPEEPAFPALEITPVTSQPHKNEFLDQVGHWIVEAKSWILRTFRRGMLLSIAVHGLILLALSFIVFRLPGRSDVFIEGAFGDMGNGTELDVPGDSTFDTELPAAAASPMDFVDLSATITFNPDLLGPSERIAGALGAVGANGTGNGTGGSGSGRGMGLVAVPSGAITKGSFTVWTDPRDPEPGQAYDIVIQVKLPKSITSYKLRDLTGTVQGTDKYYKEIRFSATDRKPVKDGVVQVRVPIPGAAVRVRDTIKIHSTILKEEQTIEIVF